MNTIFNVIIGLLLGLGSGYLTLRFTNKKDPSGKFTKTAGMPVFYAKILTGLLVGVAASLPTYKFIATALSVAVIVAALTIGLIFKKLDNKKAVPMIMSEFIILSIIISVALRLLP